jgi:5-(carboxyamino)imidazole ribonucleotide mutase
LFKYFLAYYYPIGEPMSDVLIVFGSNSDAFVYDKLAAALKEKGISFELRICSAHRTPEKLAEILQQSQAKVIIAGAGLSAALPGVIASHTVKPVIGLPVSGNYQGLDALLSVHQMPPGIPVLGVGVDSFQQAADAAEWAVKGVKSLVLVRSESKAFEKAKKTLEAFEAEFMESEESVENSLNIEFVPLENVENFSPKGLTVAVPVNSDSSGQDALKLFGVAKALWVGLNRGENAALACLEIISAESKQYANALLEDRARKKAKVFAADEEERKRLGE